MALQFAFGSWRETRGEARMGVATARVAAMREKRILAGNERWNLILEVEGSVVVIIAVRVTSRHFIL